MMPIHVHLGVKMPNEMESARQFVEFTNATPVRPIRIYVEISTGQALCA